MGDEQAKVRGAILEASIVPIFYRLDLLVARELQVRAVAFESDTPNNPPVRTFASTLTRGAVLVV